MKILKTLAVSTPVLAASMIVTNSAFALSTEQDTAVAGALTSGSTSVGIVVTGLIGIAAIMTGLGIVYSLLKR